MKRALFLPALCFSLAAAACSGPVEHDPDAAPSEYAAALSALDAQTIVDFVNYPGTDLDVLDHAVGLDARAAQGIIAARDGADGVSPSADDRPFSNLAAIDAIPYVGDAAFQKLQAYASAHPAPKGETVEGVAFAGWESQAVVYGVNNASLADLDALLDDRAANALFAGRPFASVTAMGPEAYVGPTALHALEGHALAWWNAMLAQPPSLAVTFDGVAFDATTAPIALAIANQATLVQLTSHAVTKAPANALLAGRPYATLANVAAVKGVGQATLQAILAYAKSGTWISPVTGFTLDATTLANDAEMLKESLSEDEGFSEDVVLDQLAAGDHTEAVAILSGLMTEIDKLTAPLLGQVYTDSDAAQAAVDAAAPVKQRTKADGWSYLAQIGIEKPGTASCTVTFDAAVGPHLDDVLFMSESDRELLLVSYPGAGASAPTAASVLALVGAPAGSTAALRDPADFYTDFEPSGGSADPAAPKDIQAAFTSKLTDVVYVAVTPPAPNQALVQVYLVGRTSCGDLVGLTSISIET